MKVEKLKTYINDYTEEENTVAFFYFSWWVLPFFSVFKNFFQFPFFTFVSLPPFPQPTIGGNCVYIFRQWNRYYDINRLNKWEKGREVGGQAEKKSAETWGKRKEETETPLETVNLEDLTLKEESLVRTTDKLLI